jgi:hypothetical protein
LEEMRRAMSALRPYIEDHPKACPDLKAILKEISQIEEVDPIAVSRAALGQQPYVSHTFYRRNPMHCGLWIHNARTIFHKHAVTYAAVQEA